MENTPHNGGAGTAHTACNIEQAVDVAGLTRGMVRGEEAAYLTFHRCYFDRLARYLWVVAAGNETVARDALQATFTRVVRYIRVFTDETVFWSWLTVLARSALVDQTRTRRRYFAFLERFAREPRAEIFPPEGSEQRLAMLLDCAVCALPEDEQKLLSRKYADGRTVGAIADELNTTAKAVESHLVRIRRKLKGEILAALKHEDPN